MANILIRDLQPGAVYAIQLRSDDGEAVSEWNNIQYVTTTIATIGPRNVENLVWVPEGDSFVGTWDAVTTNTDGSILKGVVTYEVIVSNGVDTLTYRPTENRFVLTFEENRDGFGSPAAEVTIFVRAVNTAGVKSPTAATTTATNPAPEPPTNLEATEYTNQVVLTWDASPDQGKDVEEYRVWADDSAGFTPAAGNIIYSGLVQPAVHHSTEYSTEFYYKVAAVDKFGTLSTYLTGGPFSPLGIVGTIDEEDPDNPTGVTASVAANADPSGQYTDLTVTWTGPTPAGDSSLSHFNVRYGYDGTAWDYVTVPRDELTTKISRLLAGGSIYVQLQAQDFTGNTSAWVNAGTYPVTAGKDTTAPSTPRQPTATKGVQRIQVSHNLKKADNVTDMESDLDYFEVYASTTSGFTPGTSNMLGTMKVNVVAIQTFDIPASSASGTTQNWYAKVIAVDKAGNKSAASAASAVAAVDLILTANIGSAQITDAKINDLAANKITAGTGLVNDLTVKSKLTLGDASTVGAIETFGYSAGVTGARFDKNLIEINQGSIAAAALRIQNSPNLLPLQYSGFEYSSGYYTTDNGIQTDAATIALDPATSKFEAQSLKVTWSTSASKIYLGNAVDDYNIPVEPGDYLLSFYAKNNEGTSETITPNLVLDDTTVVAGSAKTLPVSANWSATQYVHKFTVPSGIKKALVRLDLGPTSGDVHLDGFMIERKTGATDVPSAWKQGSQITTIDGGMMRTGLVDADMIKSQAITTKILEGEYATFDWFGSKLVVSRELTTAESGRRWWAGPAGAGGQETGGMKMFDDAGFAYIDFPDNGNPAEFKGGVNALTLDVSGESKLAQTQLGKGQPFILNMGTTPPTTAPSVTPSYETFTVNPADESTERALSSIFAESDVPNWKYVRGFYVDATEILVMEWKFNDDGVEAGWLWIYDRATRNCLRRMTYGSITNWEYRGITKIGTRYFTMLNQPSDQIVYEIFPHTGIGTKTLRYQAGSAGFTNLGNDGTNLLLSSETSSTYRYRVLNVTTWTIGAQQIQTLADPDPDPGNHTVGILTGNFDFGAARIVVAGMSSRYIYSFSSGTEQTGEKWPVRHASSIIMRGLSHDGTNFYTVADDGLITKYSNITWTSGSSTLWAAPSWRNTIGNGTAPYESPVGKEKSITFPKRAFVTISHPNVPPDNDPVVPNDEPDSIGIYVARQANKPVGAEWKFQDNTARFSAGKYFTTLNFAGNTKPDTPVVFPSASPSKIISTVLGGDGLPLIDIRADGYSRMNQLVVNSSVDANADANNTPALRVGPITGNHLRIDGNEILSMNSNTTGDIGYLLLNQNGETRAYQFQANTVTGGPQRAAAPYARLYRSSSGSWANNASATVPLVLDEETDATFGDTANNRLVCPINGIYMIVGSTEWAIAAGGRRELSLFKNGNLLFTQKFDGVTAVTGTVNQVMFFGRCSAGDIFRIDAYQNASGGGPINMVGGINSGTYLMGRWWAP